MISGKMDQADILKVQKMANDPSTHLYLSPLLLYNISTASFCTTYISIFHHSVLPSSLPSLLKCIKLRRKLRFSEVPHPQSLEVLSRRLKLTGRQRASFSVNSAAITRGARNWQQLLLGLSLREKYKQ